MTSCFRLLTISSLLATVLSCAAFAIVAPNVMAQQSGLNNHASESMMYKEKNFIGDRRAGDIYKDRRQVTRDQWDVFRRSLRQTADRSASSAGSNQQQYSPTNGAVTTGGAQQSAYGNTSSPTGLTAVPSIHGSVLNSQNATTTVSGAYTPGLEPATGANSPDVPGLIPTSVVSGAYTPSADTSTLVGTPSADTSTLVGTPSAETSTLVETPSVETSTLVGTPGSLSEQPIAGYGTFTPGAQTAPTVNGESPQLNIDTGIPIDSYGSQ